MKIAFKESGDSWCVFVFLTSEDVGKLVNGEGLNGTANQYGSVLVDLVADEQEATKQAVRINDTTDIDVHDRLMQLLMAKGKIQ